MRQVHTHPGAAFHSPTDDAWPIVHLEGFLSLVLPDFGLGPVGLARSYLAEMGCDGDFHEGRSSYETSAPGGRQRRLRAGGKKLEAESQ